MMQHNMMRRVFLPFMVLALVFTMRGSVVFAGDGDVGVSDKVQQVVQKLAPGTSIISIEKAQLKGFWEVAIESRGQKMVIYVDPEGEYVLAGSLIKVSTGVNLTKRKLDEINKVDVSLISLDDALVLGNPEAKNRVIVFNDPD